MFNKFDIFAWIEWIGDSYWFCSLSNQNVISWKPHHHSLFYYHFPPKNNKKWCYFVTNFEKVLLHTDTNVHCDKKSFACVKYIKVMCYIINNQKRLTKSKVKLIWFEKLYQNKQKMMGLNRRVKAIALTVFRMINGDSNQSIIIEGHNWLQRQLNQLSAVLGRWSFRVAAILVHNYSNISLKNNVFVVPNYIDCNGGVHNTQ